LQHPHTHGNEEVQAKLFILLRLRAHHRERGITSNHPEGQALAHSLEGGTTKSDILRTISRKEISFENHLILSTSKIKHYIFSIPLGFTTMAGNYNFFIFKILICFISFLCPALSFLGPDEMIHLKNSLVYEQYQKKAYAVNSEKVTFFREVDLSQLSLVTEQLIAAVASFENHCNILSNPDIIDHITPTRVKYTLSNETMTLSEAAYYCKQRQGFLPEPHTYSEYNDMRFFGLNNQVDLIPAGIYLSPEKGGWRFISDDGSVHNWTSSFHSHVAYGGTEGTNWKWISTAPDQTTQHEQYSRGFPPTYAKKKFNESHVGYELRMPYKEQQQQPRQIMCAHFVIPKQGYAFKSFTSAVCDRDKKTLINMTITIANELKAVLQLEKSNINFETHPHFTPNVTVTSSPIDIKRSKRGIGLVAAGITTAVVTANAATSIANGDAPLSWFGMLLGKLFGFTTQSDFEKPLEAILQNSHRIAELKVNIAELLNATNVNVQRINGLSEALRQHQEAILDYLILDDLKNQLQMSLLQIQLSAAKVISALEDTVQGHLSSYVLPQQELEQLIQKFKREHHVHLDNNRNAISTSLTRAQNKLYILINVPIIDEESHFRLYAVRPIPAFVNSSAYEPIPDADYLAINIKGDEYTILTADEFQRCQRQPGQCQASGLRQPIIPAEHCVVQNLFSTKQPCSLRHSRSKPPFVKLYENKTVFSVEEPVNIFIKCFDPNSSILFKTNQVKLEGMGTADIQPRCIIRLPDGRSHKTPAKQSQIPIAPSSMFHILTTLPAFQVIHVPKDEPLPDIPHVHLTPVKDPGTVKQLLIEHLTTPAYPVIFGLKFIILFASLFLLCSICLFSPKIRLWLRSCCMFQSADLWTERVLRNANPRTFLGKRIAHWNRNRSPYIEFAPIRRT